MRATNFSVRWEGLLTPDATAVGGGGLRANPCAVSKCPAAGVGARVWLDGSLVIDAWEGGENATVSCAVDWERGVARHIVIEYFQTDGSLSPSFFLQWSLLSANQTAAQSIAEAVALAQGADATVVVVGGANNDKACTTEGEGIDRATLDLGGTQGPLLEALAALPAAAGPVVTVLMGSKPPTDPVVATLGVLLAAFQVGACVRAGPACLATALPFSRRAGRSGLRAGHRRGAARRHGAVGAPAHLLPRLGRGAARLLLAPPLGAPRRLLRHLRQRGALAFRVRPLVHGV